jgi:vanillate O-demethylase ferredoxin subunit
VAEGETMLDALLAPASTSALPAARGFCGTCEVKVLEGIPTTATISER